METSDTHQTPAKEKPDEPLPLTTGSALLDSVRILRLAMTTDYGRRHLEWLITHCQSVNQAWHALKDAIEDLPEDLRRPPIGLPNAQAMASADTQTPKENVTH